VISYGVDEAKEGVVLGALKWASDWRNRIPETIPPPLHGRYGVIYDCGDGPKWVPFFGPGDTPDGEITYLGRKIPTFYHQERIPLKGLRYVKFRYSLCPDPGAHVNDPDNSTFWGVLQMDTLPGQLIQRSVAGRADHIDVSIEVDRAPDGSPAIKTRAYMGARVPEEFEHGAGLESDWRDENWPMSQLLGGSDIEYSGPPSLRSPTARFSDAGEETPDSAEMEPEAAVESAVGALAATEAVSEPLSGEADAGAEPEATRADSPASSSEEADGASEDSLEVDEVEEEVEGGDEASEDEDHAESEQSPEGESRRDSTDDWREEVLSWESDMELDEDEK
jgi:hypothetical protein